MNVNKKAVNILKGFAKKKLEWEEEKKLLEAKVKKLKAELTSMVHTTGF